MTTPVKRLNIDIPWDMWIKLQTQAHDTKTSLSDLIREAIDKILIK